MPEVILVTGGAGFIGSHVCKALAANGRLPVTIDTLEKGHSWAVQWGPLVHADIGDENTLEEAFRKYRPFAVVHLAGYIEVGESVREPQKYLINNASKSQVLIEASIRHRVEAFVFSSTCAVYGAASSDTMSEDTTIAPLNPYAASKADVEARLERAASKGLRSVSLRYFNASGADPDGQIGESHRPETHLIPLACDAALGFRDELILYGLDYPTPDGSCVRDFVHVCDLADAHVRAIDWLSAQSRTATHSAFNIGTGHGYSVLQVIGETERIVGRAVPYILGARRSGDAPKLVANATKAGAILGWRPQHSLASQIETALRWRLIHHRQKPIKQPRQ